MRLLVNHQLILFPIYLKQSARKISNYYCNFSVLSFSLTSKNKDPNANLEKCHKCRVSIEIVVNLKVYFFPSNRTLTVKLDFV